MGKVILTASGKGGVGKSVFTVNLGAVLAGRGLKVVIIDMNIGLRNLDIYLGLENKVIFDIADVVGGVCKPNRALVKDKRFPHLYLLSSTQAKDKFKATGQDMTNLYDQLRDSYDYIIADGPAGLGDGLILAAAGADLAVVVTTLEYISLRDADTTTGILYKSGISKIGFLLNKVSIDTMHDGFPTVEEASNMLKLPLYGIVQYDYNIHLAANSGIPIVHQKGNYVEDNFNRIADRIIENMSKSD